MSWFNINYLNDPNFIKSVNSGGGYKAIGDALMALGGIYNAERDRKYKEEQDKKTNAREDQKLEFEKIKADSKAAYDMAGVDLRKAQALYNQKHGNYYDAKTGIDLFDAKSKDAKRKSDMGANWANVGINQQKANDLRAYQQGRLAISGGGYSDDDSIESIGNMSLDDESQTSTMQKTLKKKGNKGGGYKPLTPFINSEFKQAAKGQGDEN